MSSKPHGHEEHPTDKYATRFVDEAGKLEKKGLNLVHKDDQEHKKPAGGYDGTPVPDAPPGYTIRITFHRAENLPFSDFNTLSTDAYIHATLKTNLQKRHKQDPDLFLRTPTIHRNTNPTWETQWVIAHVPASGFFLKCRLYDEDPADHDDRLGNVHVNVGQITDKWHGFHEQPHELKKRMGSKRAYTFRGVATLFKKGLKMSGSLILSVECLGRSPGESGGRCYTVAPLVWARHNSPLIGRIAGTKDREESKDGKKSVERYNFQAIQMQLRGPVPAEMYHRYVEFKPFVAGMFTDVSFKGRILNRALHHQHARIYNYDTSTIYGIFERPCIEMTKQFLEFVHYDQGGRIYTYVLSLDGLWRFTETGKEFGVDMLSKHTMHSDVSIYIAFSGEFFIRRLKHTHHENGDGGDITDQIMPPRPDDENENNRGGQHTHDNISKDPAHYELIIDNDSGTYRPNAKLLPLLKEYLAANLPGLRVATLDCQGDAEKMGQLKGQQRDRKKNSGKQITYMQNTSNSSLSSSDEEELDARAEGRDPQHGYQRKLDAAKAKRNGTSKQTQKDQSDSVGLEHAYHHPNGEEADKGSYLDRDSRDIPSSTGSSGTAQIGGHELTPSQSDQNSSQFARDNATYTNKELPTLLKKDANGHMPVPQEYSAGEFQDTSYTQPETGKNKPAGGIVYGGIINTAGVERGCPLGIGDTKEENQATMYKS